jgi:hypothetical protein
MVVVKEFNKRCPRAGCHDSGSFEVALQQVLQYQQVDVAVINDRDDTVVSDVSVCETNRGT